MNINEDILLEYLNYKLSFIKITRIRNFDIKEETGIIWVGYYYSHHINSINHYANTNVQIDDFNMFLTDKRNEKIDKLL